MNTIKSLICLVIVVMSVACNNNHISNDTEPDGHKAEQHSDTVCLTRQQIKTVGITMCSLQQREIGMDISASGSMQLEATNRADITTLMAGRISKICVAEGTRVAAGQIVAYIENTAIIDIQRNYLAACQEEMLSQNELMRQRELSKQGAGVERMLQQTTASYQTAKASKRALAANLKQIGISTTQVESGNLSTKIPVRSPIAGSVSRINISLGSYIDVQTPIMQICKNSAIYCKLNIYESNISYIAIGQNVEMCLTAYPKTKIIGRVRRINPTVDPTTRAFAVMVDITNKHTEHLAEGMYVTGIIQTGSHSVSALPDEAIVNIEGRSYIFVAIDGNRHKDDASLTDNNDSTVRFRRIEINADTSSHGFTQVSPIKTPLPTNSSIVNAGAFYIASMMSNHGEE